MGGRISVDSARGARVHVSVVLPVIPVPPTSAEPGVADGGADCDAGAGSAVLVVDDNAAARAALEALAGRLGARVTVAASGRRGDSAARSARRASARSTCVLIDFQMPQRNGLDVLARRAAGAGWRCRRPS